MLWSDLYQGETHFVDGCYHRVYAGLFRGTTAFVPKPLWISGSSEHQRKVLASSDIDVQDVTGVEPRSPTIFVGPTSARQARPSSEMRMFICAGFGIFG